MVLTGVFCENVTMYILPVLMALDYTAMACVEYVLSQGLWK